MRDGRGVEKWTEFELKRINRGVVARKKTLSALLKEVKPQCTTRDGEPYVFDPEILARFEAVVREGEDLQLPITLYFSTAAKDSGYISDETAAKILRRLEDFGEAYQYRGGKMWLPNSLAYTLLMKYPTAIQGLFL